jgi:hypothetical protein
MRDDEAGEVRAEPTRKPMEVPPDTQADGRPAPRRASGLPRHGREPIKEHSVGEVTG